MILPLIMFLAQVALAAVAYFLYKPTDSEIENPLSTFKLSGIKIGTPIPIVFGMGKIGGTIIDWGDWTVVAHENRQTKKG